VEGIVVGGDMVDAVVFHGNSGFEDGSGGLNPIVALTEFLGRVESERVFVRVVLGHACGVVVDWVGSLVKWVR